MAETNGENDLTFGERLARLDASHVQLMTDHEVSWARHEKFVAEMEDLQKKNELAHQRFLDADAVLAQRITDLVSGIGAFMRRGKKE